MSVGPRLGMSALRSKTDILQRGSHVRYVPLPDVRGDIPAPELSLPRRIIELSRPD
jgi:hypothetical protein